MKADIRKCVRGEDDFVDGSNLRREIEARDARIMVEQRRDEVLITKLRMSI